MTRAPRRLLVLRDADGGSEGGLPFPCGLFAGDKTEALVIVEQQQRVVSVVVAHHRGAVPLACRTAVPSPEHLDTRAEHDWR